MEGTIPAGKASAPASGSQRAGRWRSGRATRQRILSAARARFARQGYDTTTVRAIAADAQADPAMVYYFFGSKQQLFAAAMELPANPAESLAALLNEVGIEQLGHRLVRRFLEAWDGAETREPLFLLARSATTKEDSAAMLRDFLQREIGDRLAGAIGTPDAQLRVSLINTQLIGLALARYVIRLEPIVSASHEELVAWLGPIVQNCLTGPTPNVSPSPHTAEAKPAME